MDLSRCCIVHHKTYISLRIRNIISRQHRKDSQTCCLLQIIKVNIKRRLITYKGQTTIRYDGRNIETLAMENGVLLEDFDPWDEGDESFAKREFKEITTNHQNPKQNGLNSCSLSSLDGEHKIWMNFFRSRFHICRLPLALLSPPPPLPICLFGSGFTPERGERRENTGQRWERERKCGLVIL